MPIADGLMDVVSNILMDSEPLGKERLSLFSTPIGQISSKSGQRKTYRDTNLFLPNVLEAPDRFLVTGIRCAFLESNGNLVPIHDAIYWTSTLEFSVSARIYWKSPLSVVVDPMILTRPEDWDKMSLDQKLTLINRFSNQTRHSFIPADQILPPGKFFSPEVEGVLIYQQQPFQVTIDHSGDCPDRRILCIIDGNRFRSIL